MKEDTKPIKVAIYCRVAHEDTSSINLQKENLRIFAEAQGYDNLEYYLDNGESGLDFKRPAFFHLEADIQAGKIGKVIASDISRIGRNSFGVAKWIDDLRKRSIEFITPKQSRSEINLLLSLARTKKPRPHER